MTDLLRFLTEKWQPGEMISVNIVRSKEKLSMALTPIEA